MKRITIDRQFFIGNRARLIKNMKPLSVAILNSNDEVMRNGDQNFPYRQNSDLFYLTGLEQEKCILTLCPQHPDEKLREVIFTIKPDENIETWTGHKYTKEEIREISGVMTVKWLEDFELTVRDLVLNTEIIYFNNNEYLKYIPELVYRDNRQVIYLKEQFPGHQFERLAPLLTKQRLIKQKEEIELINQACYITESAFRRVLEITKTGMKEYEIEAEISYEFTRLGAKGHAYQPIIGTGKNALTLHYIKNSDQCEDGDLLLMDFGAEYGNYAADCTRTIPVNGKFSPRQKACYEAVLRVQKEAIKLFVPGNTIDKINKQVWKLMEIEMIDLGLFSQQDLKNQDTDQPLYSKYLMHGVTHFIGLDVHDVGSKYEPFKKGMVLTIEPGIYIKEEGIGIRIENNILVDDEPVDLMVTIPREVSEIEVLMAHKN